MTYSVSIKHVGDWGIGGLTSLYFILASQVLSQEFSQVLSQVQYQISGEFVPGVNPVSWSDFVPRFRVSVSSGSRQGS